MAARPCPGSSVFERMAHEGAAPDDQLGVKLVTDGLPRAGVVPEFSRMAARPCPGSSGVVPEFSRMAARPCPPAPAPRGWCQSFLGWPGPGGLTAAKSPRGPGNTQDLWPLAISQGREQPFAVRGYSRGLLRRERRGWCQSFLGWQRALEVSGTSSAGRLEHTPQFAPRALAQRGVPERRFW
jgi:hypothetical protein